MEGSEWFRGLEPGDIITKPSDNLPRVVLSKPISVMVRDTMPAYEAKCLYDDGTVEKLHWFFILGEKNPWIKWDENGLRDRVNTEGYL